MLLPWLLLPLVIPLLLMGGGKKKRRGSRRGGKMGSTEERVRQWASLILQATRAYPVVAPSLLAGLIENESGGYKLATRYECRSSSGKLFGQKTACPIGTQRRDAKGRPIMSRGLVQFLIGTAEVYGLRATEKVSTDERADPEKCILAGAHYLSDLIKKFGDEEAGLAAYNAGEGNVKKYRKKHGSGVPNPKYVEHVQAKRQKYLDLDSQR